MTRRHLWKFLFVLLTIALSLGSIFPIRPRNLVTQFDTAATDTSEEFLKPTKTLRSGVKIAKTAPTIDFAYFPGQAYRGNPWSAWGDSLAANGKYYASIADHLSPAGNGLVY